MGTEPPALVPQRPLAKPRTNHSLGAILPAFPPPARGPAPRALRGTRPPASAPTRADREPPLASRPISGPGTGKTSRPSRHDATLPLQGQEARRKKESVSN